MILSNGKYIINYIPSRLPCGIKINKFWREGMPLQCCRIVCSSKVDADIEICYRDNKKKVKL